ncbi:MAG: ATP synthase F1 subunit gamma [Leptospiraceae bacterium]|nr:ATP synthase F1 subunit gamma [Leptospiraceae bacterium]
MATPREIKKRIQSVKNTRKITRTMEMVATSKSKKMSNKVNASKPFAQKIEELAESLSSLSSSIESPLLRKPEKVTRIALLVVTANRGLCGGYNSNVLKLAKSRIAKLKEQGIAYDLYVIGKKGISFFKFVKEKTAGSYTNIDDKSGYAEAEFFANLFKDLFSEKKVDKVEIISTVYHSSASQTAEITPVLPIESKDASKAKSTELVFYEPNPERILEALLPMVVNMAFYKALLEAVTSEQIARRIAMKAATDAAGEMVKILTRGYNRVRQAKITQEISEIVAGADSLN